MQQKINLVILGDSNAKGVIRDIQDKYVVEPNSAVNIISEQMQCEMHNISFFGQTLEKAYKKGFVEKVLEYKSDTLRNIVAINLGGNDSDYDWSKVSKEPTSRHSSRTNLNNFEKYYRESIHFLRENGFEVYMCTLLPFVPKLYFDTVVSKLGSAHNIMFYLDNDVNNLLTDQITFNEKITQIANDEQVKLLDVRTLIQKNKNWKKLYCDDGIHLSAKGHEYLAKKILDTYVFKHNSQTLSAQPSK